MSVNALEAITTSAFSVPSHLPERELMEGNAKITGLITTTKPCT
ncbi:hypothetical protein ACLB1M_18015 [Escherichia coli]